MVTSVAHRQVAAELDKFVIKTSRLSKTYRDGSKALTDLNLQIERGELFGLIGPDGSGKTTALRILDGLLEPSSGEVLVFGRPSIESRRQIGYVSQSSSLYPDLTVDENLRYEAGLRGIPEDVFARRRQSYLQQLNLHRFPNRLAGQLSGGMKQKLALCCALISHPRLLLLDEPTTGLDPVSRRELWQMLFSIAQEGVTMVMSTPYLEEAERCHRVALLHEGATRKIGTPLELQEDLHLRRLEVFVSDLERGECILSSVAQRQASGIVDICILGDRIDVLVKDSADVEQEVRSILEAEKLAPDMVHSAQPDLENVFIMCLREHGYKEPPPPDINELRQNLPNLPAKPPQGVAISAKDLSKDFGNFKAVNKVNFEVNYGEIFGLIGANGAGKTTTVKMLCGLVPPTSGQALIAGESWSQSNRDTRKKVGYMSQKFSLYPGLTVKENLEFCASIYEIPRHKRPAAVNWALKAGGLSGMENRLVKHLPLGWKQRIAFGAAVLHAPEVLFLDEPTAGIDPIARRQLWTLIRDIARNGTAVLITTHYLDEAEYCHRLALMTDAEIITQGSPSEIKGKQHGKLYQLSTQDSQSTLEVLKSHLDWWRVSIFDGVVHVLLDNEQEDTSQVKSILKDAGIHVRYMWQIPFSLEDAFIAMVQRNHNHKL